VADETRDPHHELVSQVAGNRVRHRLELRIEDDLGQSIAIPKIDKDQAAEVTTPVHPTGK
jgi:hypothetical protein